MGVTRNRLTKVPISTIDRYPGKMVAHLARRIVVQYACGAGALIDPFCGSGTLLVAAKVNGIPVTGVDINPIAALMTDIKLNGFDGDAATNEFSRFLDRAVARRYYFPVEWEMKDYWFTPATLMKYEFLRGAARHMGLCSSQSGRAILLALALSARPCSLADQRSPKPFISKWAIASRTGKHFDPIKKVKEVFELLVHRYGKLEQKKSLVFCEDITDPTIISTLGSNYTHIITSPPYINAQDYFRNWKIELYLLQGLIPFFVEALRPKFIGTECGGAKSTLSVNQKRDHIRLAPALHSLSRSHPDLGATVHRYLSNMAATFELFGKLLRRTGTLVMICGDNLIGSHRFETSAILNTMVTSCGFRLVESFSDRIRFRNLPPKRCGHKGLIKEEIISVFQKEG